jgi:putative transcriptional regulator
MNNRLRVLRAERAWSQQDLAERLEVSRQSVNAIETGRYDPSLPLAFKIADLFGLTIEAIFLNPSKEQPQ